MARSKAPRPQRGAGTVYEGTVEPDETTSFPGEGSESKVRVDGRPLDPRFDLRKHSPDGFSWGYSGSGPAQLALAVLADFTGDDDLAQRLYQSFKGAVISQLPQDRGWRLTGAQVQEWLDTKTVAEVILS